MIGVPGLLGSMFAAARRLEPGDAAAFLWSTGPRMHGTVLQYRGSDGPSGASARYVMLRKGAGAEVLYAAPVADAGEVRPRLARPS